MRTQQRGVTMIGWIFLLIPVAIVAYGALRAFPKYMDYYKLVSAMKETASQLKDDETLTPTSIRQALERRFDTGYIEVDPAEIEVSKSEGGDWQMTADYEETAPMFANLSLAFNFKQTVVIR